MTSIHKNKRDTESNGLRKLLPQISTQIIGDSLSTKSTIQEEKEMKMKTKEERELSTNDQKHLGEKQDPFL